MKTQEIEMAVRAIYHAFQELNAGKLDENFTHTDELTAFGTDEDEFFYGWEEYKSVHETQIRAVKSFRFTSTDMRAFEHGDIGWFSDRAHWEIETKAGEKVDTTVRITGVLLRQQGKWRIIQWHVSQGVKRLHEY